ncbi:biotin-dependent carboxyltransferase family protein [Pseudobacillus badius]|uniref:5-oxoprolinase subunit C family protein n=1 Tax=Bacillus badius TaxID=1455 RepID=UPI000597D1FD|nr:biotin-dependent carboxyltransferase family protein [Bacillus badius]KIL74088.1 Allophanate hydrolase 2 subunit 2 [Bacillus badius]MED0668519.1 biotin-dependent carboxyltransferase family protein [Bacillus badius]GLY11937.1 KipI antagonist [Bacillus badius]
MTIRVLNGGLLTTVQDLGRYGAQKYGVIASGAMDAYSLRVANLLVGNQENEGALEITLWGTSLSFERDCMIAITGGDLLAVLDGEEAPTWRPLLVRKGSVLQFKSPVKGCRAYVAIAGGIAVPEVMGSKSTYLRAGIGGFRGRALQKNDVLMCGKSNQSNLSLWNALSKSDDDVSWAVNYEALVSLKQEQLIRVIRGTEFDRFDKKSQTAFFSQPYHVTTQADRMGYRMEGAALSLAAPDELLSEGVTKGTVQVPPNGQPIILMADRQTTGGYPKIGQIISADLSTMAQLQPRAKVHFQEISLEAAERELLRKEQVIHEIKMGIRFKELYS